MSTQNQVYECSRINAAHTISNSEWINEWNEGIKLNKGDTVRLLGSFISELGDGNDISVNEDTPVSILYNMYVNADTVKFPGTTDAHYASSFQLKLGDIAQPAYATDNFGTEPPYCGLNKNAQTAFPNIDVATGTASYLENRALLGDRYTYRNVTPNGNTYQFIDNDDAVKIGSYFDTSSGIASLALNNVNQIKTGTLTEWNARNMTEEYYIAQMSKLCNFPKFRGVYTERTTGNFVKQNFYEKDKLEVGDYVSSYYISNFSHWVDENQPTATYTTNEVFGDVKWQAGPQSVVGRVAATNYKYVNVYDPVANITKVMEISQCYVQDFINPSSYKFKNDFFPGTESFSSRHGRPEKENGYNNIKYQNRTAGVNSAPLTPIQGINADGKNYYKPLNNTYNRSQISAFPALAPNAIEQMNGEVNMGLSFLWSCGGSNMYPIGFSNGYPKDVFTSWVHFDDVKPGVFTITGDRFKQAGAVTDTIIYVDSPLNLEDFKAQYPINSEISDFGSTFTKEIVGILLMTPGTTVNTYQIFIDSALGVVVPLARPITLNKQEGGWYWYPRYFTQQQNVAPLTVQFDRVDTDLYQDVGAIVKMNPDNDQVESYTPEPGTIHRLYIPYAHQQVGSPYKVRNFGAGIAQSTTIDQLAINNTTGKSNAAIEDRIRHNFGVSCAYVGSGDMTNPANRSMPVPYQYGFGAQPVIPPNTISGVEYVMGSGYNEPVLSVYFQNEVGDCRFPRINDFTQTGFNAKIWKEDLLYIKQYKSQITIPAGFYENNRIADLIDEILHYTTEDYQQKEGTSTTVTDRERNWTTGNNVLRGNFVHTYIPELTYGFFPETIANSLVGKYTTAWCDSFFQSHDATTGAITSIGQKDMSYYCIPFNYEVDRTTPIKNDRRIHLFRLIGAKLFTMNDDGTYADQFDMQNINPSETFHNRILDPIAWNRNGGVPNQAAIMYQNRSYLNTLMYGGQSKIWVGAVNPTFSYDSDKNLFGFSFLYTPYRPATDEGGSTLTLVGGEAVPSAIINAHSTGGVTSSLSGIYISAISSDQPNANNTTAFFDLFNNGLNYPTPIPNYLSNSIAFWNSLGFTTEQLTTFSEGNNPRIPYIFYSNDLIFSHCLRNLPNLDISVNGSNPLKSYCSLWAPALQYAVIIDSNFVYGAERPKVTASPFYLIGSSFPTTEYYGGKGTKLPIIGICSRQFSSFGYAFDLSESAVTLTIDQDCTITSIKTKIYNNDFTIPANLDSNSSVVYVIERNNYYTDPTPQQLKAGGEEILEENAPVNYTPQMFEYLAPIEYHAPLFDSDDSDFDD